MISEGSGQMTGESDRNTDRATESSHLSSTNTFLKDFDARLELNPESDRQVLTNFGSISLNNTVGVHTLTITGLVGFRQILGALVLLDRPDMRNGLNYMEKISRPRVEQTLYTGGLFHSDGVSLAPPGDELFDLAIPCVDDFHIQRIPLNKIPTGDTHTLRLRTYLHNRNLKPPTVYFIGKGGIINYLTVSPNSQPYGSRSLMLRGKGVPLQDGYFGNANDGNLERANVGLINTIIEGIVNDLRDLPKSPTEDPPIKLAFLVRQMIIDDLVDSIRRSYFRQDKTQDRSPLPSVAQ